MARLDGVVRHLSADDVSLMTSLIATFGEAFGDREAYCSAPPRKAYLERLLGKDDFIAVAAIIDGKVVGGFVAYELRKFEQERSEIYIYDLAVLAPFRRRGIATALIERLRGIAAERGAYVIFVQADHGDDAAIALYAKLGRREDVLHFDIAVAPSGRPNSDDRIGGER
jgi:aminoglycoside 3-N-acetyltransferase I